MTINLPRCPLPTDRPLPPAEGATLVTERGPLPLQGVDLRVRVTGLVWSAAITQRYTNSFDVPLEATYTFPLPDRAAVAGLLATLGGVTVVGELQDLDTARATYRAAMAAGQRAALVEQLRDEVFTAKLGNLGAGQTAEIILELTGLVTLDDGFATLRFPLLVSERYAPAHDVDPRLHPPRTEDVTVRDVHAEFRVDPAGLAVRDVRTSAPATAEETPGGGWLVRFEPGLRLDRDLLVRYDVLDRAGQVRALLATDADDDTQGTWQVVVAPPAAAVRDRVRRDVVLLLDRSGSMSGWAMLAARRATARIIESLGEGDRFAVLAFDTVVEAPPGHEERPGHSALVPATDTQRQHAAAWAGRLEARGGTEMSAAFGRAHQLFTEHPVTAGEQRDRLLVLITDGQITNEQQLVAQAAAMPEVRIHTLGIGVGVNAGFLQTLAGPRGRCELAAGEAELDRLLLDLSRRLAPPLLTDVTVTAQGVTLSPADTTPAVADVFAAGPAVLTGRWTSDGTTDLAAARFAVTGAGQPSLDVAGVTPTVLDDRIDALRTVWARRRVRDLEDALDRARSRRWSAFDVVPSGAGTGEEPGEIPKRAGIVELSLAHGVLSRFTGWVAVGPGGVTGERQQVDQPLETADPWSQTDFSAARPMRAAAPYLGLSEPVERGAHLPMAWDADDEALDVPEFPMSDAPAIYALPASYPASPAQQPASSWMPAGPAGPAGPPPAPAAEQARPAAADAAASPTSPADRRGGFLDRLRRRRTPSPASPAVAEILAPFAEETRALLDRLDVGGSDDQIQAAAADLARRLGKAGAPKELVAAVDDLGTVPDAAARVRALWYRYTGTVL